MQAVIYFPTGWGLETELATACSWLLSIEPAIFQVHMWYSGTVSRFYTSLGFVEGKCIKYGQTCILLLLGSLQPISTDHILPYWWCHIVLSEYCWLDVLFVKQRCVVEIVLELQLGLVGFNWVKVRLLVFNFRIRVEHVMPVLEDGYG